MVLWRVDMKDYMQAIIDYVDDHIEETLTLEDIEKHIGYSKYYLHKLFTVYTGFSLMQYVRYRKLLHARANIAGNERVVDVAYKYGYQSERAFRRAFKRLFKESPSMLKNQSYQCPPKMILNKVGGINMLGYLSDVSVVEVDSYYTVGIEKVSKEPEADSINHMAVVQIERGLHPISEIGMDIPVTEDAIEKGYHGYANYLVIPKEEYDQIDDHNLIKKEVNASKYVKLTIYNPFCNPFERIPTGWKKLSAYLNEHHTFNESVTIPCFEEKVTMMDQTVMNIYTAIK
jgi:AraC-like DNA-binding protein